MYSPEILYEDNHLICVNKKASELVQGDKTGDTSMQESIREFIKKRDGKPGNVFLGVIHRLDRPVSGVVLFAKTSKALSRMNNLFKTGNVKKTYWAIVTGKPGKEADTLRNYLRKNQRQNRSYVFHKPVRGAKESVLNYKTLYNFDNYSLLEIELETGRHHQIRCQLSSIGHPVMGDLKYGSGRSTGDGSIGLHARMVSFKHPVKHNYITIKADPSGHKLWDIVHKQ